MQVLSKEELYSTEGGAGWSILALGAGILFAGIIDGYIRPLKCN